MATSQIILLAESTFVSYRLIFSPLPPICLLDLRGLHRTSESKARGEQINERHSRGIIKKAVMLSYTATAQWIAG